MSLNITSHPAYTRMGLALGTRHSHTRGDSQHMQGGSGMLMVRLQIEEREHHMGTGFPTLAPVSPMGGSSWDSHRVSATQTRGCAALRVVCAGLSHRRSPSARPHIQPAPLSSPGPLNPREHWKQVPGPRPTLPLLGLRFARDLNLAPTGLKWGRLCSPGDIW